MDETLDRVAAGEDDPPCLDCGGMLKSATISFGENLVPDDLDRAQRRGRAADVFLAVGTSLGVYPAAGLPEIALRNGARLIIVNAQETPFDHVADAVVREQLGACCPQWWPRSDAIRPRGISRARSDRGAPVVTVRAGRARRAIRAYQAGQSSLTGRETPENS